MKGRASLTLLITAALPVPLLAEENATDATPGWSITSSRVDCKGEYKPGNDQIEFHVERSYSSEVPHKLLVYGLFDWQTRSWLREPIVMRVAGSQEIIGDGSVFQLDWGKVRATVSVEGQFIERLANAGSPVALQFLTKQGVLIGELQTDAFATSTVMLADCFEQVGADLLAARPLGEDGRLVDLPPRPLGVPDGWVTIEDYPSTPVFKNMEGMTTVRIMVDRFGFPQNCEILQSSGYFLLDAATCRNMLRRARFYPARDGNGDAVAGHYQQSMLWQIP